MSYKGGVQKIQKVMVQPINLIFRYLQNRARIQIWLYENVNLRIEGHIIGFDEYMNLVLDEAEEIHIKTKQRKQVDPRKHLMASEFFSINFLIKEDTTEGRKYYFDHEHPEHAWLKVEIL